MIYSFFILVNKQIMGSETSKLNVWPGGSPWRGLNKCNSSNSHFIWYLNGSLPISTSRAFGVYPGFDIIRWSKIKISSSQWDDRIICRDGEIWSWGKFGVCVEYMVELANRLGADPWFSMPKALGPYGKVRSRTLHGLLKIFASH